jgi:uncharacterized membrane protein
MKKGSAFIFGMIWLGLFSGAVIIAGAIAEIGGAIVTGAVGIVLTYIGGNVADNWQRSKHYHQELDKDGGGNG